MHPDGSMDAARLRVLQHFSVKVTEELAKNDSHPAMRVVTGDHGPMLQAYIAEGATRLTGMRVRQQGSVTVVGGDMVRSMSGYYPAEPSAQEGRVQSQPGGWNDLRYYDAAVPKAVVGRVADIRKWFDDHAGHAFAFRPADSDADDLNADFTAEVRLLSFKRKGEKGYVDLGGATSGGIEAFKGALGLGTAGIGEAVGGFAGAIGALKDAFSTVPDLYELGGRFGGKAKAGDGSEIPFDRGLAEELLEFEVSLHEGAGAIYGGKLSTCYVWNNVPEAVVEPSGKQPTSLRLLNVAVISKTVLDYLIPSLLDKVEHAVT